MWIGAEPRDTWLKAGLLGGACGNDPSANIRQAADCTLPIGPTVRFPSSPVRRVFDIGSHSAYSRTIDPDGFVQPRVVFMISILYLRFYSLYSAPTWRPGTRSRTAERALVARPMKHAKLLAGRVSRASMLPRSESSGIGAVAVERDQSVSCGHRSPLGQETSPRYAPQYRCHRERSQYHDDGMTLIVHYPSRTPCRKRDHRALQSRQIRLPLDDASRCGCAERNPEDPSAPVPARQSRSWGAQARPARMWKESPGGGAQPAIYLQHRSAAILIFAHVSSCGARRCGPMVSRRIPSRKPGRPQISRISPPPTMFEVAARHGNAAAMNELGHLYLRGQGVAQDCKRAHMWFSLAPSASRRMKRCGATPVENQFTAEVNGGPEKPGQVRGASRSAISGSAAPSSGIGARTLALELWPVRAGSFLRSILTESILARRRRWQSAN